MRRKGIKVAFDERVLGGDDFIERLLSEAEERERETLRIGRKVPDLLALAKRVVEGEGIEETELRSGYERERW